MEVVLDRDFRCAPEGHTVEVFRRGQRVSGRVAELAVECGAAKKPRRKRGPSRIKPAFPSETK